MSIHLDPLEQRLVGVLVEKELTVPESYPLTVNSLVTGSNQKNNRDPQLEVQDYEIEGALKSLMLKGWVVENEREGGRTRRYAHQAGTQLGVAKAELAILTELLLRGPQTPQELKTRGDRMTPMGSAEEVERRLRELAARPVPYVRLHERQPGERYARWGHLLGPRAAGAAPAPSAPAATAAATSAPAPSRSPGVSPSGVGAQPGALDSLRELVETLEQRVLTLEERLDRLAGR